MFKVIEINKENIKNDTRNYNYSDDIYGILIKTGSYINARDIIYQIVIILF